MKFQKGDLPLPHKESCGCFRCTGIAWNKGTKLQYPSGMKGRKHTDEARARMSVNNRKRQSEETKQKISKTLKGKKPWNTGKILSEDHKSKISKHHVKNGVGKWMKGRKKYENAFSFPKGANHYNWQGGITSMNTKIRRSKEYVLWRTAVFMRDDYTCQECRQKGGRLEADHIKPFALYPELRLAIDNGRTLCEACHKQTDTYGSKTRFKEGSVS